MADRPPPFSGPMPSSFDDNPDFYDERRAQKIVRKLKEEPLVPLGIGFTVLAFVYAYRAVRRGDSQQANRMFRVRVAAQGFTVMAMVGGSMFYSADREKTKELRKLREERDAEEKRQKWIRELEIRDQEEKDFKAKLAQQKKPPGAGRDPSSSDETPQQTAGGLLGKMGLWPQGDKNRAAEQGLPPPPQGATTAEGKPRKENPKSSLGAIGEAIASKKKEESEPKTAAEGGAEKKKP